MKKNIHSQKTLGVYSNDFCVTRVLKPYLYFSNKWRKHTDGGKWRTVGNRVWPGGWMDACPPHQAFNHRPYARGFRAYILHWNDGIIRRSSPSGLRKESRLTLNRVAILCVALQWDHFIMTMTTLLLYPIFCQYPPPHPERGRGGGCALPVVHFTWPKFIPSRVRHQKTVERCHYYANLASNKQVEFEWVSITFFYLHLGPFFYYPNHVEIFSWILVDCCFFILL